jgi:hypothetical protein
MAREIIALPAGKILNPRDHIAYQEGSVVIHMIVKKEWYYHTLRF